MTTSIKWTKTTTGYVSDNGRFEITRYIRRGGIEWGLVDRKHPIDRQVSGCVHTLREAKDCAVWRLKKLP